MIALAAFCEAVSRYTKKPVQPQTELVRHLHLCGDDFDLGLLPWLKREHGLELEAHADLLDRIPPELHLLNFWIEILHNPSRARSFTVSDLYGMMRDIP